MSCLPGGQTFVCPPQDEIPRQALALLPRGDAWATSDGGFDVSTVLARYWTAVGHAFGFVYQRLCVLREEFWCATQRETHAEWMLEFGLPDACDPFPDLCLKVSAIGGARCVDLIAVAARAGWNVSCGEPCGAEAGLAETGCDRAGLGSSGGTLYLVVHVGSSPAYAGSIDTLRCLLDRVVHAHLFVEYVIVGD